MNGYYFLFSFIAFVSVTMVIILFVREFIGNSKEKKDLDT